MTYLYEQLSPEKFQQFCQTIISAEFPNTQCLPVAQPDGGRDAVVWTAHSSQWPASEFVVFQVKFSRNSDRVTDEFIASILEQELPKVQNLKKKGLKTYYLLTNVRGTAHLGSGSIDRMHQVLSDALGIPAFCWWRDDLDRRVDSKADIKWSYPEIIRGSDLLQALLAGAIGEDGKRRDNAIQAYIAAQYREDSEVKFKQIDLYNSLLDLFVDTNLGPVGSPEEYRFSTAHGYFRDEIYYPDDQVRAASYLLNSVPRLRRIVLEGALGQGKSAITQYVCQVHRMRLLDKSFDLSKVPVEHVAGMVRIPMRVDLRDFASWISGINPFASDLNSPGPADMPTSLEGFLAFQITQTSGGHSFSVSDLSALARLSHLLIVLDGFDEVADIATREQVVKEISKAASRLEVASNSLQIVVTSRPAAFAKSPGFAHKEWDHLVLLSMTIDQINSYADKWLKARTLPQLEKEKFKQVLREKLDHAHMRDLARNPMQLAILLSLIQTKGLSLPDKRTALYDSYMDMFFSREAEKSPVVREHRDLLIELHRYLAWIIQTEAEGRRGAGSVTDDRLKALLHDYLVKEGHQTALVDDLFTGMTERVVALVSRVQGTFEFEVQPLREYFAARHLYETAPYSPPGEEKSGTKPERFDALARNFYWLNVTRFYCGCYSRGELSSLADGLIELSELDELKDTSYPKVLILMLLSDWVFTQQPHTIKRLIAHIVNQPGLKILLANVSRDRASVTLLPPERCGREDLLEAIEQWFNSGVEADVCSILASSVRDGLMRDSARTFWAALSPPLGQEHNWLLFGRLVGAFYSFTHDDARNFFTKYGDNFLWHLCASERYDIIEADSEMFESAVKGAIRTSGSSLPFSYSPGKDLSFLGSLGIALDLSNYTILFDRDWSEEVLTRQTYRSILMRARSVPENVPTPPKFESTTIESCKRFLSNFDETIKLSCKEWAETLKPWSTIVEAGVKEWGDSPVFLDIALIAAGIASKTERGQFGLDFQDETISICERLRFARLKSGAPQWWSSQLKLAKSSFLLPLTTLLCWATVRTALQLTSQIEQILDSLSKADWFKLVERIKRTARVGASNNASLIDIAAVRSDRLFLSLALRLARPDSDRLIFSRFKNYKGDDAKILEAACDSALRIAPENSSAWNQAIHLTAKAYSANVGTGQVLRRTRPELNIPESIAKKICQSASQFPLALVYFAQSLLQTSRASEIGKPLGELARKDRWFHGY